MDGGTIFPVAQATLVASDREDCDGGRGTEDRIGVGLPRNPGYDQVDFGTSALVTSP
jgi:hypothetical protein